MHHATRAEIECYRQYGSAGEVLVNFKRGLDFRAARKVHTELQALRLPAVEDIRDELEAEVRELSIH